MNIKGYRLEMTCGACPEQYDVIKDNVLVGYLRLRHGYFQARYPDVMGELVYDALTKGDGIFADDKERRKHLKKAIKAIRKKVREKYESIKS